MGSARVEMYKKGRGSSGYPGSIKSGAPVQVSTETTSTTATTAGSRITVPATQGQLFGMFVVDEDCYVSIAVDPTATATNSYLLKANVQRELPLTGGNKISFKDVA